MPSRRVLRIVTVLGVIAVVQTIGILVYRGVESGREPRERRESSTFAVERLSINDVTLTLERPDATRWTLSAEPGRPVVLHFWATWCGPCRTELPTLIARETWLASRGIDLVLASVDDNWNDVRAFFGEGGVPSQVSRTTDDRYKRLTTGTLPETLFIDARGSVHARARGARDWTSPAATEFLNTLPR